MQWPDNVNLLIRKAGGQAELADELGVSQATVSRWKKGIRPKDVATLSKVAEYAGTSVDDILSKPLADGRERTIGIKPETSRLVTLPVILPSESTLIRLFEGLLPDDYGSLDRSTLVQNLALRLPAGLQALTGGLSEEETDEAPLPGGIAPPPSKGRLGQKPERRT